MQEERIHMTMKDYSTYFEGKDWVHQLGFCAPD